MARGHQKAQSQVKNQAKQKAIKSKQGHNANEQKKAAAKALTFQCPVCRVNIWIVLFLRQTQVEGLLLLTECGILNASCRFCKYFWRKQ